MIYRSDYASPLGTITLASDGEGLTGLWFSGQKHYGAGLSPDAIRDEKPFRAAKRWLDAYFSGVRPDALPPLRSRGTPFQLAVWQLLLAIPYGETTTYGALAREYARQSGRERMSAQAIGQAVGRNPISIIIPCHRVCGAGGAPTGYAAGVERKQWLLALERGRNLKQKEELA